MKHKRVLILSAAIGSGHKTAAHALEVAFRKHSSVEVVNQDVLEMTNDTYRRLSADTYIEAVKRVPWLVGWTYQYNDEPFKNEEPIRKLWDVLNTQPAVKFLREYKPDICVCTHFMPAGIVAQLMARNQLDTALSVVMTDYDFQGMWLSRTFNRYFVARDDAKAQLIDFDVDAERVTVSGIPVDERFGQPVDRDAVLQAYDLQPDLPIVLVSAGAVGGGPAQAIVKQMLRMRQQVQTVVVCGSNTQLRRELEALTLPRAKTFRILGFSSDMPNLVRVAALFVGKPGGLTASECMAAATPMVIVTPIPGQEERNADYLLEEGAAVRCNNLDIIDYKIEQLLANPERLIELRAHARRVGKPDAASVIAATTLADEQAPVRYDWRAQRRRLLGESIEDPITAAVERVRAWAEQEPEEQVALYDDATGIYFGTISAAQFRGLRKNVARIDEHGAVAVVANEDIEHVRERGFDSVLLDRLERRVATHGPVALRSVRVHGA